MKFSIIIPIFNREKFIKETLSTCINQTYKEIEIICVDDCSGDNSLLVLNDLSKIDSRIKIIQHQKNMGPHSARKTGVENCTGDYVLFLDCDDSIDVFACQKLNQILTENNYDILEFGYKSKNKNTVSLPVRFITIDNLFDSLVYFKNPRAGTIWNKAYRKDFLQIAFSKMKNFYSVMGEDLYESIIIAYYAESYNFINNILLYYNDETGISNKKNTFSGLKNNLTSIKNTVGALKVFFSVYAKEKSNAELKIEEQYLKYVFYYQILIGTEKDSWRESLNLLPEYFSRDALLPYEKKIKKNNFALHCELIKFKLNTCLRRYTPYKIKKIIKRFYESIRP